jgi:predicted XRE-type DNA-binding protein
MRNGTMQTQKRKSRTDTPAIAIESSSGNVYADLGLPHPEEALAKAELVIRICDIITRKKLTQAKAAALLGIDQPKVSALMRGKFLGYSIERLVRFLNCLGQNVEIVIKPRGQKGSATTHVAEPVEES